MKKEELRTPCYVIDMEALQANLECLSMVKKRTGCKILLAQKAFSCYATYPLIAKYLDGATASSLHEAILGKEEMKKENHIYAPAFREDEMEEILENVDHIVFNSVNQLKKFQEKAISKNVGIGLRINPEHSTQEHGIYDPCAKGSRLGTLVDALNSSLLENVEGFHFHTLCEQNSDALKETLNVVEEKFGKYMYQMKWINFGGGHHITRKDYDIETLIECIQHVQDTYHVTVYLEPGEAIALNAGYLYTHVLDVVKNGESIAILDTSAACHMPDVIEMPYRPPLKNSGLENEKEHNYILSAPTCLAGDVIGKYSFDKPLQEGTLLEFEDMAIYTMVKNNTFNGMQLPDIVLKEKDEYTVIKSFGYSDFKERL